MLLYILFDLISVLFAFSIIIINCRLSFFHPGSWLLIFHLFVNSLRYFAVYSGAPLLDFYDLKGPNIYEFNHAFFWSDIALISSAIFIVIAEKKKYPLPYIKETTLNNSILNAVIFITLPLGIIGGLTQLFIPTLNNAVFQSNNLYIMGGSYFTMIQSWFGLSLLALIYFRGFKKIYVIPFLVYLVFISLQGNSRYRLILPLIFFTGTYLLYQRKLWPSSKIIVAAILLLIVFYPLKQIGYILKNGGNFTDVKNAVTESFEHVKQGEANDQMFLDEYAVTLVQIDSKGKFYFGSTLLPLIYSPIPKAIWPNKPALNQWQVDVSSSNRMFGKIGSISTIYGEAYANFGYFGIIFIPGLFFYALTRWYKRVKLKSLKSIEFFFYLVFLSCLLQVLRDGLRSVIVFPVINNMPLFLIFIAHKIFQKPALYNFKMKLT